MFCTKCGTQIPDNYHFCPRCGTPVSEGNVPTIRDPYNAANFQPYKRSAGSPGAQIGAAISAIIAVGSLFLLIIIPYTAKQNRSSTDMMSAWAFEYQWGENFLFSCGAIFVISLLVAIGLCIYNNIKK
ncbi:MAG: zinc-ribbon domain-containing protein [Hominenteromicrobium sp.]